MNAPNSCEGGLVPSVPLTGTTIIGVHLIIDDHPLKQPAGKRHRKRATHMTLSDHAAKLMPIGSLILRASDSRLHLYRVRAWVSLSGGSSPVCLAYNCGGEVRIPFMDVLPWQSCRQTC